MLNNQSLWYSERMNTQYQTLLSGEQGIKNKTNALIGFEIVTTQWKISPIYYINSCILCVCVRVFVTSELFATGRHSGMLLSPTWRASPGKLCQLVFQLVRCEDAWFEKKPLQLFRR